MVLAVASVSRCLGGGRREDRARGRRHWRGAVVGLTVSLVVAAGLAVAPPPAHAAILMELLDEFAIPGGGAPASITAGPDGNLWFTDGNNKIGKVSTDGTFGTPYQLPAGSNPFGITSGPDQNIWFTEHDSGKIGKINRFYGITEYGPFHYGITSPEAQDPTASPLTIAAGPDGNLWFTDGHAHSFENLNYVTGIGKVTVDGEAHLYPSLSWHSIEGSPQFVAAGPDGRMWSTSSAPQAGPPPWNVPALPHTRIDATRPEPYERTVYDATTNKDLGGIAAGPDGNMWFTEPDDNKIGRITPSGEVTESDPLRGSRPRQIVAAPDGTMWFTEEPGVYIGHVTMEGKVTEYTLPPGIGTTNGITVGPDGNIWFTEGTAGRIARLTLSGLYVPPSAPTGVTASASEVSVTLSWTSPASGGAPITGYVVTPFVGGVEQPSVPLASTATTQTVSGLTNGTTYTFRVAARNLSGVGARSAESAPVTPVGPDRLTHYTIPGGGAPAGITVGPDGHLWYTDVDDRIGNLSTNGVFATPYPLAANSDPFGITVGSDGNLWFTEIWNFENWDTVGKITTSGAVTEYPGPTYQDPIELLYPLHPEDIAAGPDGDLWFTDNSVQKFYAPGLKGVYTGGIHRVTTGGVFDLTPDAHLRTPVNGSPNAIAVGPDGRMWVTRSAPFSWPEPYVPKAPFSQITAVAPDGSWVDYDVRSTNGALGGITAGPDGNMWFTEFDAGSIGRMTTAGVVAGEYPVRGTPLRIAAGPDGNLYFTERDPDMVGRVTTAGVVTEWALPAGSGAGGITAGPDGNIWFTEGEAGKIGRLDLKPFGVPSAPSGVTGLAGDQSVMLSWSAAASDGGSAITGYVVTPFVGGVAQGAVPFTSTATTQAIGSLVNGTTYTFTVAATNLAGTGPASAASSPVKPFGVPSAPTGVSGLAGDRFVGLSWSAPASDGGSPVTGYVVTPFVGGVAQAPVPFASTWTTQTISGLTNGTAYTFRVAAANLAGTGPVSEASDPMTPVGGPSAPSGVSGVAGDRSVVLSWSAPPSDGGSPVTGYVVTPFVGGVEQEAVLFESAATTQTIVGLTNGASYTFTVAAINVAGVSLASGTSSPVTPFGVPSAPSRVNGQPADRSVVLSWSAPPSDGGSPVTGYVVTPFVGGVPQAAVPFASTATTQTISGLTNGTTYTFTVAATNRAGTGPASAASPPVTLPLVLPVGPLSRGYWLAASDGGIFAFGDAAFLGSTGNIPLNRPIVGMAATPSDQGYWLVASDGGIFAFGDAGFFGSTGNITLNRPVVGMAATPSGRGYWLVANDGGVFAFGDAAFLGSTGNITLRRPIVGMAATPSGHGYWLVASDGGIFAFGDAAFLGSTGNSALYRPVVGMAASPSGQGYWLVSSDGGIFAFGDAAYLGSTGNIPLNWPVVGMAASPSGQGYWLVGSDGGIFAFGDAPFFGSTGNIRLNKPIVAMTGA